MGSYPINDGRFPRMKGAAKFSRCPGCGAKVQMPCFICASRKAKAVERTRRLARELTAREAS